MRRFLGALCKKHNLSCTSLHCTRCPLGSIHSGLLVCLVLECAKLILACWSWPLPFPLPSISLRASHLTQLDSLLFKSKVTLPASASFTSHRASPVLFTSGYLCYIPAPGTDHCLKVASCFMVYVPSVPHQEVRFRRGWAGLS